ncbi:MAG TPA: hypothetical protein VJ917_00820 [Saprospiraceae bacterium]|nr:hypothetical protein [Saprospiraceae bacterium]
MHHNRVIFPDKGKRTEALKTVYSQDYPDIYDQGLFGENLQLSELVIDIKNCNITMLKCKFYHHEKTKKTGPF